MPPVFDPARLPAHVQDRLMRIGYGACPPDLREMVGRWDELDELEIPVAENQLGLLAGVLAAR
jgi:hypothetical protein